MTAMKNLRAEYDKLTRDIDGFTSEKIELDLENMSITCLLPGVKVGNGKHVNIR